MNDFENGQQVRIYDQEGYFKGEIVGLTGALPSIEVDFADWIERFGPSDLRLSWDHFEEFWQVRLRGTITETYVDQSI